MNKTTSTYLRQLGFWLRFQGVEGPRVVTILLEVRTHVAESSEDPYETFGEPRAYAKAFAEGSRRRWLWGTALVIAVAASIASVYLLASEVASHRDYRPLPFGGHAWVVVAVALVAALIAWRAFLVVAVRPLSSLAYDESAASSSWRTWIVHRRDTTVAVVVVLIVGSVLWGWSLGNDFLKSPQVRASNYVWAIGSSGTPTFGVNPVSIGATMVIYVTSPGPKIKIVNLSLSRHSAGGYDPSVNIIPYPTLESANRGAHNHNFGGTDDLAVGTTLKFGTYYLLQFGGEIDTAYNAMQPAESLIVDYSVNDVANGALRITLPVTYN
jgi:hypothetical protein